MFWLIPWDSGLDKVSLDGEGWGSCELTYTADVAETYPSNSRSCHGCLVEMDVYAEHCKTVGQVSSIGSL